MSDAGDKLRFVLRGQWADSAARYKALDAVQLLEDERDDARAENQQLRDALGEACDWLDADLADALDTPTALADRDLVSRWRAALDGTSSEGEDE